MPRLRYSAESKEDLKQIARFIAKDKPVAARQWVAKLREKCRLVANHTTTSEMHVQSLGKLFDQRMSAVT